MDMIIYDIAGAALQANVYSYSKIWAQRINNIRKIKQAEFQE